MKKLTTDEWISKAIKVHSNKYDYSKVEYKGSKQKVCIICPEHGEFQQTPNNHLNGQKCPKCAIESNSDIHRYTLNQFIEKANSIHNNKYDYSK